MSNVMSGDFNSNMDENSETENIGSLSASQNVSLLSKEIDEEEGEEVGGEEDERGEGEANLNDFTAYEDEYETLTAEIREFLTELVTDRTMDAFRAEYEKLFSALEKSHNRSRRLMNKCAELAEDVISQEAKTKMVVDKSNEDRDIITNLKKDTDKAWKMVDIIQEREDRARETIEALNTEIQNLTKTIEAKTLGAEDTNINELRKIRDELINERDQLKTEMADKKDETANLNNDLAKFKADYRASLMTIDELKSDVQAKSNELNREVRRKERTEREIKQLKAELAEKIALISESESHIETIQNGQELLQNELAEEHSVRSELEKRLADLSDLLEELKLTIVEKDEHIQSAKATIEVQKEEIGAVTMSREALMDEMKQCHRKLKSRQRSLLMADHASRRNLKEITFLKREVQTMHTKLDTLRTEKAVLEKRSVESACEIDQTKHESLRCKDDVTGLRKELVSVCDELGEARTSLANCQYEHVRNLKHIAALEDKCGLLAKDVASRDMKLSALSNQLVEKERNLIKAEMEVQQWELKMRQHHTMFQTVRQDRSLLHKQVVEANDTISDLRKKLHVSHHQFEQLKAETLSTDGTVIKLNTEIARLNRVKDELQIEIKRLQTEVKTNKTETKRCENAVALLEDKVRQMSHEMQNKDRAVETAIARQSQLNVKTASAVATKDEAVTETCELKVEIANHKAILNEREEEIKLFQSELKEARLQEARLVRSVRNLDEMRLDNLHLQKTLIEERSKMAALGRELENPANVHRWRQLEGSDPDTFELLRRVQSFQKNFISHKEEIVTLKMQAKVAEKTITDLRTALERQSDRDTESKLYETKQSLRACQDGKKYLTAERDVLKTKVEGLQHKVEVVIAAHDFDKQRIAALNRALVKSNDETIRQIRSTVHQRPPLTSKSRSIEERSCRDKKEQQYIFPIITRAITPGHGKRDP